MSIKQFNSYKEAKVIIEDIWELLNSEQKELIKSNKDFTLKELHILAQEECNYVYEFSCYYADLLGNLIIDHLHYIQNTSGEGLTPANLIYINDAMISEIMDDYGDKELSYFECNLD